MKAEQIMNDLKAIIEINRSEENVYNTFLVADEAIRNKKVVIEINPEINEQINQKMASSVFGGLYFRKNKLGIICLVFGQKYLDTYNRNSCMHYTMLIHEYKHIYDYCLNKETFFKLNKQEHFFFELEARKIEVEFIRYYLKNKFNLGKYESFILRSFENDQLESITITIDRESASVYQFLYNLELAYKTNNISRDQLIEDLISKAEELLGKANSFMSLHDVYNENGNDKFSRYTNFVRIKTFEKFTVYLFKSVFTDKAEIDELLVKYPEIENKLDMISHLIYQYHEANNIYALSLNNYFENDS